MHTRAGTCPHFPSRSGPLACFLSHSFEFLTGPLSPRPQSPGGWAKQAARHSHLPILFSILTKRQERPIHISIVIGDNFSSKIPPLDN